MKPYFETRLGKLYNGDVLEVLRQLPDESVQCCITSPPYWGLRKYFKGMTFKKDLPGELNMARLDPKTIKLWNGRKWVQVLGTSVVKRQGNEIEINLRSGERISCTPLHRFPTNRGMVEVKDLKIGDVLKSTKLPEPENCLKNIVDDNIAWFLGLYLAEGSRSEDTIQIAGHIKEQKRLIKLCNIVEKWGGSLTYTENGNERNIRIYSRLLNAVIDEYISGKTAKNKGLKVKCWKHDNNWLKSLLNGYLSGDGYWDSKNKRWRIGFTRNYNLERDLRTLSARLGFKLILKLSHSNNQNGKFLSFKGEIRFNVSNHHNNKDVNEIVDIKKSRCRKLYDIGVANEPHMFCLSSGILTHNSKPNPMPESVTDRPTKAHEYLFLMTKSPKYFYDADAIRESHVRLWNENIGGNLSSGYHKYGGKFINKKRKTPLPHLIGRNKRTVWTIPTQSFPEAHFATFPVKLVIPCIKAGTSEKGNCPICGKPWVRITDKKSYITRPTTGRDTQKQKRSRNKNRSIRVVLRGLADM